jgi:hypothetical protein
MRRLTRSHDTIRAWAEQRGGKPARVKGTEVPRLAFDRLPPNWEALSWDQFFLILERGGLALWYEDSPGSRLCKLTKSATERFR